jgi:hypothetical protein
MHALIGGFGLLVVPDDFVGRGVYSCDGLTVVGITETHRTLLLMRESLDLMEE